MYSGTQILSNIHNDLKLLITSLSEFSEGEEAFQLCEKFAFSQIKHHRYLSVNSHAIKKHIEATKEKFLTYGKYKVAKEFEELVQTFLTSFNFELHPQYDIQWSLLSLLFNLATQTGKSEVPEKLNFGTNATIQSVTASKAEDIDWGNYLKEGNEDFFYDYKSDSDSDPWTDDEIDLPKTSDKQTSVQPFESKSLAIEWKSTPPVEKPVKWLNSNVQNRWWDELDWRQEKVDSVFDAAHMNDQWRRHVTKSNKIIGTISEYKACRELLWMFQNQSAIDPIRNVTIPSLTVVAFNSTLASYKKCFQMLREIEEFLKTVFAGENLPPLTLEAYAAALHSQMEELKNHFVDLEIDFMKQDGQNTFLRLSNALREQATKVRILHEIHVNVTKDWEKCSNWECASKLLSKLYFKLENSSNPDMINICVGLYLSSFSVYLNLMDTWLREGRLEDWRNECIIFKTEPLESLNSDENKSMEGFSCRELDEICKNDPIMTVLVDKVCQIGRSVELLVTLDRISNLWDSMDRDKCPRQSLYEECLKEISSRISLYCDCDIDDGPLAITEIPVPECNDLDRARTFSRRLSSANNPFLHKVFEKFLSVDVVDSSQTDSKHHDETSFFSYQIKSDIVLPWKKIFEDSFVKIVDDKFSGASKLVKNILMKEYKLEQKFKLMRSVYMMETSHVMNNFCQLIFTEIESNGMWNNSYFVTSLLEEVLLQKWPDSTSRWSITVSNIRTTKVLEAVDSINLHYAAGWPINMILNEETLEKYNKMFKFELKLKWALWTLNTLKFSDLENIEKFGALDVVQFFFIRRLESLRFWLLHSIGSIHAYLSGQVLLTLGTLLEKSLSQANNLEAIVTIHNQYLDNVQEHGLQTPKFEDLMQTILQLLQMCDEVRSAWKPDSLSFIGGMLDSMENNYVKYHTFLALGLHSAVQHKDADYHKLIFTPVPINKADLYLVGDYVTQLGKNIFNEIAHQTSPPSGLTVKIPKREWEESIGKILSLSKTSGEYEQVFAYLRRCRQKELSKARKPLALFVKKALHRIIEESNSSQLI